MKLQGLRWAGSRALLAELDSLDDVLALHAHVADERLPGQIDLVPAARTLLVTFDSHRSAARAAERLADIDAPPINDRAGRTHEIEVVYDGEDLNAVAELTGLDIDGVIAAHTGQTWRAAFSGFAPGFVYLAGENDILEVPRRESPRTEVPPGAVALAGPFSAIYPRQSPGGWQLIGRTNARLWDIERDTPAMIQAGDTVRYVAVDRLSERESAPAPDEIAPSCGATEPSLEIIDASLQSLIEDLGRVGQSHLGVSVSGVADESAARQANRLVGNAAGDAVIETVLGGLTIVARGDLVLACTGAAEKATIDGPNGRRRVAARRPFLLHDGETFALEPPSRGLRSYLAARGGLDVPTVLASRSRDALSGIGPAPLTAGDRLAVGEAGPTHVVGASEPDTLAQPDEDGAVVVRVVLGPRHNWFNDETIARFTRTHWQVTQQSNRIGVRLALPEDGDNGAPLTRCRDGELPSEGAVPGAVQIPPSGLPVLFLKDHPVTGGYPVIAVILASDLPRAAQLAPDDTVRFAIVDPDGRPSHSPTGDSLASMPDARDLEQ
ncbi:5-oxoprolinase subunit B/C family protein [Salinisphaera orenii]|uniref:5-oxoprolinase subunit B/C family protein n=1 Tax=Salinisphaera orenii TaxID=856731 RepID=UPI000DBEA2AE